MRRRLKQHRLKQLSSNYPNISINQVKKKLFQLSGETTHRSVCLEVVGVPPFAWRRPNFECAVAQIGRLARLDPKVDEGIELELTKF